MACNHTHEKWITSVGDLFVLLKTGPQGILKDLICIFVLYVNFKRKCVQEALQQLSFYLLNGENGAMLRKISSGMIIKNCS